jgi:GTPase
MRAVIVVPVLSARHLPNDKADNNDSIAQRSGPARMEEARGLAAAIDLAVVHETVIKVTRPRPATLIGEGSVEAIGEQIEQLEIGLAIVDHPLTPVQQRNLERAWKVKVIDRTGLILEIFGRRANTREGVIQVELAHLTYQKGRLVRSWTHLERQRGGGGFMGGPGETQIETDRRLLQDKIDKLKLDLEQVTRTRLLHRAKRQKVPHPIVALVGYTNAGKSTLFNRITGAEVLAVDMLFATLDPTLRRLELPHGGIAILSDTVGFISNLPTHLVAAFRATLEEVREADLIIHVRDIADEETNAQAHDVTKILSDLGVDATDTDRVIEVWNKTDLLSHEALENIRALTMHQSATEPAHIPISAVTGEGIDRLLRLIEEKLSGKTSEFDCTIAVSKLKHVDWIYQNAAVLIRDDLEDGSLQLRLRMSGQGRIDLERKLSDGKVQRELEDWELPR